MTLCPSGKVHSWTCGLTSTRRIPRRGGEAGHVDLVVEVPDVADDCLVLHSAHLLGHYDVTAAGGGDHDVRAVDHRVERGDLEAVHGSLQRADRVDLGDDHPRALAAQ